MSSEEQARKAIDALLRAAGWDVVDASRANIIGTRGVAIREFPLKDGHGFADYMLYVDGKAGGVLEAKKQGFTLSGVEIQSEKYVKGLPPLSEQYRIVAEVDHRLSLARGIDHQIDTNLIRANAVRHALVERAFTPTGDLGDTTF